MDEDSHNKQQELRQRSQRRLARMGAALVGVVFGLIVAILIACWMWRDRTPRVASSDLAAARQRWDGNGPSDYDLEVRLEKQQVELHRVEVRDGQVRRYTLNGHEMSRRRTFETWSVPGMFGTIQHDVDNLDLVQTGDATTSTPRLTLWGTFHPQYGYPASYRRFQWGTDYEVAWEVTEFRVATD